MGGVLDALERLVDWKLLGRSLPRLEGRCCHERVPLLARVVARVGEDSGFADTLGGLDNCVGGLGISGSARSSAVLPRRLSIKLLPVSRSMVRSIGFELLEEGGSKLTGGSMFRLEVDAAKDDRPRGESLVGEMDLARSGGGEIGLACLIS